MKQAYLHSFIVFFSKISMLLATNYSANWTSAGPSNNISGQKSVYTLAATNPSSGGSGCVNSCIPVNASVTITFPSGTNAVTATMAGSTFEGAAITSGWSAAGSTVSFLAPVPVAKGSVFSVAIIDVTNPPAGTYTSLTMTAVNSSGGVNTFSNSNYTTVAQRYAFRMTYGHKESDVCYSAVSSSDGGYLLCGSTSGTFGEGAGASDFKIMKTDGNGNHQWTKLYGEVSLDNGFACEQTADGGYILLGYTESFSERSLLTKIGSDGTVQWSKNLSGNSSTYYYDIKKIPSGDFFLMTPTYIYKADANGNVQTGVLYANNRAITATSDGGFAVIRDGGLNAVTVWKVDGTGAGEWSAVYSSLDYAIGRSIIQTNDGGYLISGFTMDWALTTIGHFLLKLNSAGAYQWHKSYSGEWGAGIEGYLHVNRQTADGKYLGMDYGHKTMFVFDQAGDFLSSYTYDFLANFTTLSVNDDGSYMLGGSLDGGIGWSCSVPWPGSFYDFYLIKMKSDFSSCNSAGGGLIPVSHGYSLVAGGAGGSLSVVTPANVTVFANNPDPATCEILLCEDTGPLLYEPQIAVYVKVFEDKSVKLTWETEANIPVERVNLERGKDPENFDFLSASSLYAASYLDEHPFYGISYYRMQFVDENEKIIAERIIEVNIPVSDDRYINLYPNPVIRNLECEIVSKGNSKLNIEILDLMGKKVSGQEENLSEGNNTVTVDMVDFRKGIYVLKFSDPSGLVMENQKIIKQ